MEKIFIALGSNVGDGQVNIQKAIQSLASEIEVIRQSSVYQTRPMYVENQAEFLNAVVEAKTNLPALEVLRKLKEIENTMGTHEHNMPRIIDLDLVFYGDQIIDTPELQVPHPTFHERDFVLQPLSEIAPDTRDPRTGKTIRQLLAEIPEEKHSVIGRA